MQYFSLEGLNSPRGGGGSDGGGGGGNNSIREREVV